jgi:AraC-like DNA-binding protein
VNDWEFIAHYTGSRQQNLCGDGSKQYCQAEGLPLYRYQLRLRLARALDLLAQYDDLTTLSLDLGFSSHSHFSAAFREAYAASLRPIQVSL